MHTGKLLVMPRGTHQDHTPINLHIQANVMTGRSEAGNFLGRVVLSEQPLDTASPSSGSILLGSAPTCSRSSLPPKRTRSGSHGGRKTFPRDVGYCWMTNDPQPSIHFGTDTMSVTLNMGGVAI